MIIILKIAIIIFNIIYCIFKILPTQNKIVMISRQSDSMPINFSLLKKEFEKNSKYKIVILSKTLKPGIKNKILYILHMFKQMYHLSTSKAVILDSYCIAVSNLKHKKKLLIIQMWHAMGCSKKFGYSVLDKESKSSSLSKNMDLEQKHKISKTLNMHKNYDYFFVSSKICLAPFAEAFNYSSKKGVVLPLPITDILLDEKYKNNKIKEIKKYYPETNGKKIISYVPTFRDNENDIYIKQLIDEIDFDKYSLIIKFHPLTKSIIKDDRVIFDKNFSSIDILIASDYIITDYSAIVYEASLLKKPILFYVYDYDSYIKERDFYIDYKKEMPGEMYKDAKSIIKAINNNEFDLKKVSSFQKKYIEIKNYSATKNIVKFVSKQINKKNRV